MRFRFRFESLLRYRSFLKEQAEISFSKALARNRKLKSAREKFEITMGELEITIQRSLSQGVTVSQYKQGVSYLESLKKRLTELDKQIEQSNKEMDHYRDRLKEKTMDLRVIENLSRRELKIYRREIAKKESKLNDELHLTRLNWH